MNQDVANAMRFYIVQNKFMEAAYKEALKAYQKGEVPVGCVIVQAGKIVARGHNLRETKQNSLAHAEIIAINKACKKIGFWRLDDVELYVTLEPCPMCTGAILQARIPKVYFGALDRRNGSVVSNAKLLDGIYTQKVNYEYLPDSRFSLIITNFFKEMRQNKHETN